MLCVEKLLGSDHHNLIIDMAWKCWYF